MKKSAFAALSFLMMSAGAAYAQTAAPTAVSVPDGGMTVGLLAGAMLGLGVLRSKFRR